MFKRVLIFIVVMLAAVNLAAQAISLGAPLATVRLTKTEIITQQQYRAELAKVERMGGRSLTADEKQEFLYSMIDDILFLQMCERDGIRITEAEVTAYINQAKSQLGSNVSDQQFEAYLTGQGIALADLRSLYRKQILLQRWITSTKAAEIAAIPQVGPQDVLDAYELYKSKLVRPDTARIAFVFYEFKDTTEAERRKGLELMRTLAQNVSNGRESFDAIRLRASQGGYQANPSPVYFAKNDEALQVFGKKFYDVVFALADGAVSEPFDTEKGYWLVKRLEFFPQKQLELSDPVAFGQSNTVQEYLTQQLAQTRQNDFLNKVLADLSRTLRAQAEIKITGSL
ncbi:MAG: SurA N-terminal domain-containing protein [Spirochaetes bacterium]|nr:SurA N-terminal domain-containing protein [Spirochaetota bacterium]